MVGPRVSPGAAPLQPAPRAPASVPRTPLPCCSPRGRARSESPISSRGLLTLPSPSRRITATRCHGHARGDRRALPSRLHSPARRPPTGRAPRGRRLRPAVRLRAPHQGHAAAAAACAGVSRRVLRPHACHRRASPGCPEPPTFRDEESRVWRRDHERPPREADRGAALTWWKPRWSAMVAEA